MEDWYIQSPRSLDVYTDSSSPLKRIKPKVPTPGERRSQWSRDRAVAVLLTFQADLKKVIAEWPVGVSVPKCLARLTLDRDFDKPSVCHSMTYNFGTLKIEADELYTSPPPPMERWTSWMRLRAQVSRMVHTAEEAIERIESIDHQM